MVLTLLQKLFLRFILQIHIKLYFDTAANIIM